ncbi:MAG: hypothetical protein AAF368_00890 [Planctomycetota bacterium]
MREKGLARFVESIRVDPIRKTVAYELGRRRHMNLDIKNIKMDLVLANRSVYRVFCRNLDNLIEIKNDWQIPLVAFRELRVGYLQFAESSNLVEKVRLTSPTASPTPAATRTSSSSTPPRCSASCSSSRANTPSPTPAASPSRASSSSARPICAASARASRRACGARSRGSASRRSSTRRCSGTSCG